MRLGGGIEIGKHLDYIGGRGGIWIVVDQRQSALDAGGE
jgi:hypothetical protein